MGKDKGMKRKSVRTIPSRMDPHRMIIVADCPWRFGTAGGMARDAQSVSSICRIAYCNFSVDEGDNHGSPLESHFSRMKITRLLTSIRGLNLLGEYKNNLQITSAIFLA